MMHIIKRYMGYPIWYLFNHECTETLAKSKTSRFIRASFSHSMYLNEKELRSMWNILFDICLIFYFICIYYSAQKNMRVLLIHNLSQFVNG